MKSRALESPPQRYARIGGVIYVVIIMLALFGLYSREGLIVPDDAAATADNIMGFEMLFIAGLAGEMLSILGDVTLTLILYVLLKAGEPKSCFAGGVPKVDVQQRVCRL